MADIAKAEEIVRIANETLVIDTGTDWVAIIALGFSILSTIAILIWQNYLRKQDKQEQIERIQKEDKIRQWNALYPYRIKFYGEFYDVLYRFVYYKGSVKDRLCNTGTEQKSVLEIRPSDIMEFCNQFNRFSEEAKVLFNNTIYLKVKKIYKEVENFMRNPIEDNNDDDLISFTEILENSRFPSITKDKIVQNLQKLQENIYDEKLDIMLRKEFGCFLEFSPNKNTVKHNLRLKNK